ncbi:hypothetical protein ACFPRL_07855 [Pseudoclavibacter helvolus]
MWAPAASATAAGLTAPASGVVVASAVVAASVRACESMLGGVVIEILRSLSGRCRWSC